MTKQQQQEYSELDVKIEQLVKDLFLALAEQDGDKYDRIYTEFEKAHDRREELACIQEWDTVVMDE